MKKCHPDRFSYGKRVRHEKPKNSSYQEATCECGEVHIVLDPQERCWGFNVNREPLIDKVKLTKYYCYLCGEDGILEAIGTDDYYVGPSYYCDACNSKFTLG